MKYSIYVDREAYGMFPFLPPATKLGQGYVFTGVCDSVHRGGAVPDQVHPQDQVHPRTRYTPPDQVHPSGPGTPPWTRYNPRRTKYTTPPPGPGRYGLRAGGTHPTGMQSCCIDLCEREGCLFKMGETFP